MRILIIRPSALGDVCRTVPALASLRRAFPDARIDWLVQDAFAEAVEGHPALNEIVPFARSALGRGAMRGRLGPGLSFLRALRARRYDAVFDLQGLARSGLFAWATGAGRRVGFADARELGWLGLNERYSVDAEHAVDRMLGLLHAADVPPVQDMRLYSPAKASAKIAADDRLRSPFVVVAPTSRWPGKQWPAARFAELGRRLLRDTPLNLVMVGSRAEREQCAELLRWAEDEGRVIDLVGATSVGELMAVVERSDLVIANDSATLHMAVGFSRPIVALFGPTRKEKVGPYGRERDVLQHVCADDDLNHKHDAAGRKLMERIEVGEVVSAAMARLSAPASRLG